MKSIFIGHWALGIFLSSWYIHTNLLSSFFYSVCIQLSCFFWILLISPFYFNARLLFCFPFFPGMFQVTIFFLVLFSHSFLTRQFFSKNFALSIHPLRTLTNSIILQKAPLWFQPVFLFLNFLQDIIVSPKQKATCRC